jgi:hypothetical protein
MEADGDEATTPDRGFEPEEEDRGCD